jgi:hypothetical protein
MEPNQVSKQNNLKGEKRKTSPRKKSHGREHLQRVSDDRIISNRLARLMIFSKENPKKRAKCFLINARKRLLRFNKIWQKLKCR